MPQQRLIDDLLDDLTKGTALLIVGTGVSIQASGTQPCASWDGLIRDGNIAAGPAADQPAGRRRYDDDESVVVNRSPTSQC